MSEQIVKKRFDYIDMAKGFGILFVILGHIEYAPEPLRIWISTFHMPMFFVLSGIIMAIKNEVEVPFEEIFLKKARGIMIPYFWFSLSYLVIDIGNLLLNKIDINIFKYNQISSLTMYGSGPLWFLPSLFFGEIIFLFLHKKVGRKITPLLLVLIPFICWAIELPLNEFQNAIVGNLFYKTLIDFAQGLLRAFIASSFVGIAFYLHNYMLSKVKEYDEPKAKARLIYLIIGIVLITVLAFLCRFNTCADLHNMVLGNPCLYFPFAYIGSFGIIFLSKALWPIRVVKYFGRNSLIVMAVHMNYYVIYGGMKIASYADVPIVNNFETYLHPEWNEAYVLTVTVIATFLLSVILIELINRVFYFVMGRKKGEIHG